MESTPSDEAPKLPMLVPQAPRRCPPRPRRPPWATQADEPGALRPATDQGKRLAVPGAMAPIRWLRAEGQIQLTVWKTSRRVVSAHTLQNIVRAAGWAECWDQHKHEFAPCVTGLPDEVNCWQIPGLNRQRANTKNVLDELKNRRGGSDFCAKSKATIKLTVRLLLFVYNRWTFFVRFIVPQKHTEAKRGRCWVLLIVARLVQSGRLKE